MWDVVMMYFSNHQKCYSDHEHAEEKDPHPTPSIS